jgi:3-oxoacyl-[acyl-carrier protein] reductase
MRQQTRGDIIVISSRASLLCLPGSGPYAAAKAALEALVRVLSKEEQKSNIRVNAIAPGLVETEMARRIVKRTMGVDLRAIDATSPFGRIAQPEDVGNLAVFLCSKEGEYISGQVIYLHGGDVRGPYA